MLNRVQAIEENTVECDQIYQGNSIDLIKRVGAESVHLILSNIPYGIGMDDWDVLHENSNHAYLGSSPAQKNAGAVFKKRGKPINGWSEADRAIHPNNIKIGVLNGHLNGTVF